MKLSDIRVNPKNPRIIKDDKFRKLVKSLKEFPQMMELRPIIVDDDGIIQGGNMRYKALRELGYSEVPDGWVKQGRDLTPEQWREFVVKDNLGYGEWDYELLANDYNIDELTDWGLDIPDGYTPEPEVQEDDFDIPDIIETDIKDGDIFEIGSHRLICGDSTKAEAYEKLMQGKSADLVITDPPYNVNYSDKQALLNLLDNGNLNQTDIINDSFIDRDKYNDWIKGVFNTVKKYIASYNAVYAFGNAESLISFYELKDFHISNMLVWVKNRLVLGRQDYKGKHENIIYGWYGHHKWYGDNSQVTVFEDDIDFAKLKKDELLKILQDIFSEKVKTTVIRCDTPLKNDLHPTMKPILLLAELIQNSSKPGQIVLDPFLGSGSTMVAATQLKRKCYGIELDPKYCDIIIQRMMKLDATITIKRNGAEESEKWREKVYKLVD